MLATYRISTFVVLALLSLAFVPTLASYGGGTGCAGCTILVTLIDQFAFSTNQTVDKAILDICELLPEKAQPVCDEFASEYSEVITKLLLQDLAPDDVCLALSACTDPSCRLWASNIGGGPGAGGSYGAYGTIHYDGYDGSPYGRGGSVDLDTLLSMADGLVFDPLAWLEHLLHEWTAEHLPIVDEDGDAYSTFPKFRGWDWRGKDCDDTNPSIHPGVNPMTQGADAKADSNCNGIYGVDTSSGLPWETLYCNGTDQLGFAVMGDSAGAHFGIPQRWLEVARWNKETFADILDVAANEVDWPQLSGFTGFTNGSAKYPPPQTVYVDSLYMRMKQRNLCMHRDYQNIAWNGAAADALAHMGVMDLSRNNKTDLPMLVVMELVANDICHPEHTLDRMTDVASFNASIRAYLAELDAKLPAGSHVLLLGLDNLSVAYDVQYNRTHPIGVTYARVFSYLNCLESGVCWAWVSENTTAQAAATKRAQEYELVYKQIVKENLYQQFDMMYMDWPLAPILSKWKSEGKDPGLLYEPIDGLHPSNEFHQLMAAYIWDQLVTQKPAWVGAVNPNNDNIAAKFGDQGGYGE